MKPRNLGRAAEILQWASGRRLTFTAADVMRDFEMTRENCYQFLTRLTRQKKIQRVEVGVYRYVRNGPVAFEDVSCRICRGIFSAQFLDVVRKLS